MLSVPSPHECLAVPDELHESCSDCRAKFISDNLRWRRGQQEALPDATEEAMSAADKFYKLTLPQVNENQRKREAGTKKRWGVEPTGYSPRHSRGLGCGPPKKLRFGELYEDEAALDERVYREALLPKVSDVDCDDWELEQRMRKNVLRRAPRAIDLVWLF